MKTENVIWGLILVFVGGILLLENFGAIDFYWRSLWQLWPLLLILAGANMLLSGMHSRLGGWFSVLLTIVALAFVFWKGTRYEDEERGRWRRPHREAGRMREPLQTSVFSEPFLPTVKRARLNISGGATSYRISETTSNLFDASVSARAGRYSLQKVSQDTLEILNFRMNKNRRDWNFDGKVKNEVEIRLHRQPLWDIHLETGAGETDFDLRPFKISNLSIKGGAASFQVKLGEPESVTQVRAEAGVAEISISVPSSVGCRIEVESGLSSKDFEGFTQQADGSYQSPGYRNTAKKINIQLRGGLSDMKVKRY